MAPLSDLPSGQVHFLSAVHAFCFQYKGSVTSWIRSPSHNTRVGGVSHSLHLSGYACDVVIDALYGVDLTSPDVAESVSRCILYAKSLGISCLVEHDHFHLFRIPD